jgi:HTH-type transcriptional regulator/antitoxin HigA
MDIKSIRTKSDYHATLNEIESLMTAKANTQEGDRLATLTELVEAYEAVHFPVAAKPS